MAAHPDLVVVAAGAASSADLSAVTAAAGPNQPVLWVDSRDQTNNSTGMTPSSSANVRIASVGSILAAAGGWTPGGAAAVSADIADYLSVAYGLPETPAAQAISYTLDQLGKTYQWAGAGPSSFDCSGLTMMALRQVGLGTVHNAAAQYSETNSNVVKSQAQLQPGDLVFFGPTAAGIHHVGIYLGGGQFIDAPDTGSVVRFDTLGPGWDYYGATDPFAGLTAAAAPFATGSVQAQARSMVDRMWGDAQWPYLDLLWNRESGGTPPPSTRHRERTASPKRCPPTR
jgi:cell wall-associated NlpC family hydrolase